MISVLGGYMYLSVISADSGKKPNLVNLILQGRDIIEEFPADAVGVSATSNSTR